MRQTNLRLSQTLDELLVEEAEREGISKSQLAREALWAYVAFLRGRRGDRSYEQVIAAVRRRAR